MITPDARRQVVELPRGIQGRLQAVIERLHRWPDVSGAKPLRGELKGSYRVRTGDYRILFTVDEKAGRLTVFRIAHRRDVYE